MASLVTVLVVGLMASQAALSAADSAASVQFASGCTIDGDLEQFSQYGASFSTDGTFVLATEYSRKDVKCCIINYATGTNLSPAELSLVATPTPCTELQQWKELDICDENAYVVFTTQHFPGFTCQCYEDYEGNGYYCSRKAYWSEWSEFSAPTQTCGAGAVVTRTRTCSQPGLCSGPDIETVVVDLEPCAVWSDWSEYGPFNKNCGDGATRNRTRTCSQAGKCSGSDMEVQEADLIACPFIYTSFERNDYEDAIEYCKSQYEDELVNVGDEVTLLRNKEDLLLLTNQDDYVLKSAGHWIGLEKKDGIWTWEDGSTIEETDELWHPKHPQSKNSCAAWLTDKTQIVTVSCRSRLKQYLCQINKFCSDFHPDCELWASYGECTSNPGYMERDCRKACNLCTPEPL